MDSDQGKLFIGGISWETTEDKLREHFGNYGEVTHAVIMRDKITGRPRGFGFVVFADPTLLDRVLLDQHNIDGRIVEAKRALSREEQQTSVRTGNNNAGRPSGGAGAGSNMRTKKIFVGGLPATLTEDQFRQYFQQYGNVSDVVVMYDANTQRPRGFGFITFDAEDAVDRVLVKTFHDLGGKLVEVKRALPKDSNIAPGNPRSSGGGGYQSYSSSGVNSGSYENRMDSNRYMQPQGAGGGYPGYGSSGYDTPQSYGYGAGGNNVGYGGYGAGSYGGGAGGYGAPGGGFGNPNAPSGGYMGPSGGYGVPGGPRGPWNSQAPSGYGSAGYGGNASYGGAPSWNSPSSVAPTGQSLGGVYGNQGYGYGGYGGSEGLYSSQGGYNSGRGSGAPANNPSGVAELGGGPGYMGGGYGDTNGGSGYASSWKSEPSQGPYGTAPTNGPSGGPASYNTGYGRQPQQQ